MLQTLTRPSAPGLTAMHAEVKTRVLIADDNMILRYSVSRLLSMDPVLEVVGMAVNGCDAVMLARTLQPDVVLMDVNMPLMDGIEATFLITEEWPDIMVVGFSTATESYIKAKMMKAGAVDLIDKGEAACKLVPAIHHLWAEHCIACGRYKAKARLGA